MFRRFLVISCKRVCFFFLLVCLGCSAQHAPTELSQRIERQLRVTYNVPPAVKVIISAPHSSDFENYESITVTFDGDGKKQTYDFLVSKDQKTLIRMTKMDLTKDPYAEVMKKLVVKGSKTPIYPEYLRRCSFYVVFSSTLDNASKRLYRKL